MSISIKVDRLRIPAGVAVPPTVTLYYKEYYAGSYILVASDINIDADGYVLDSPKPVMSIEPGERYTMMAVNETCGYDYNQSFSLIPYCPVGYELTPDSSECFYELVTEAIAPTVGENTVEKNQAAYGTCGSYIYDEGWNPNGTGVAAQISVANPFWVNGAGACADATLTDGPLNRCGLWAVTESSAQTVGFSVCIDAPEEKIYYIGIGADNSGIIKLDDVTIISQIPAALAIQYPGAGVAATFKVWHIYPVLIPAGLHFLDILGYNVSGAAAMGCEVYNNTAAEIAAAVSYGDLDLIFSSKDYIGMPVVLGSGGIGYSCPTNYSLKSCASPFECVRRFTTPVLISES